ncbi:MAG: RNA ligase [Wendovervirus sonii]|uniref:RNA ligase n=1 Tax=phage Lak_Megaphage_Sonny TaxID=3109229 RepID=A0ABZ0Z7E1_9CAUD|nr:MAG: RNA ligase [phage Lak_Megaphage_Sonny]
MKHYDSIESINYDKSLIGENVWAFNKLDGQNLCVKYNSKRKEFAGFGSRKCQVDENHEQFGGAVRFFKSKISNILLDIINNNSGKGQLFKGIDEITFYFEWYGEHSFAGFHQEGDEMHLALIDVHLKKKGYIEPKDFYEIFGNVPGLEIPELIFKGVLTNSFIKSINDNDWTSENPEYPSVKEGVVCRRSSILKGQRMPKVKIKTKWWIDKLHEKFSPDKWKELE